MTEQTEILQERTILWAGGWDTYLLDISHIRDLTPEEVADNEWRSARKSAWFPEVNDDEGIWVQCIFLTKGLGGPIEIGAEGQCVKVVRRIDHGN